MVLYEIRKLFQKRLTILILLLLFVGNGIFAMNRKAPGGNYGFGAAEIRSVYAALPQDRSLILPALDGQLERLDEAVWEDSYDGQTLTKDFYTDRILLRSVRERCEIVLNYDSYLDSVEQNAQVLQHSGIYKEQNSFGYRNILKSAEQYALLRGTEPQVFYSAAIESLSNGRLSDIALVLIALLLALELIYSERKQETLSLIKPTAKGRVPLICAKLLCASFVLFVCLLIIYGSNYAIGVFRFGVVPLDAPLQSVYGFEGSALKISVGEYLLCFLAMKYLWLLGNCIFMMLVFVACRNLMRMMSVLWICLIPSILCLQSNGFFAYYNPIGAGNAESFFRIYRNLNIFGFPVSTLTVSLIYVVVSLMVGVSFLLLLHCHCVPMLSYSAKECKTIKTRVLVSVFRHESYKFWISRGALMLLILLLTLQVIQAVRFDERLAPYDLIYLNYCKAVEGEPNAQKDSYLKEEQARFDDLRTQIEEYGLMLQEGSLDEEGYQMLTYSIQQQLSTEEVFLRVVNQYERAKLRNSHLVCHLSYDRLTGIKGREELLSCGLLLMIVLILGISGIEASERENNTNQLINTTTGRKKSQNSKSILLVTFAILSAVIAFVPHILTLHHRYGFSGLSSPADAVPQLLIPVGTVGLALTFYCLSIICISLLSAFWIRFLSRKTGRTVSAAMLSAATLLLPLASLWLLHNI